MSRKREAAQHAAEETRVRATAAATAEETRARAVAAEEACARAAAAEEARARASATNEAQALAAAEEARVRATAAAEVVPWLRGLGLRMDEARRAAARCEAIPEAPLEERVRCALSGLARPGRGRVVALPRPAP